MCVYVCVCVCVYVCMCVCVCMCVYVCYVKLVTLHYKLILACSLCICTHMYVCMYSYSTVQYTLRMGYESPEDDEAEVTIASNMFECVTLCFVCCIM